MAYQVIARKWRPQRFDDVVGQQAVTRTLRNALASGRLAQSFVFAGPRGVGKTTTARILARALNCENGPTADPCGTCDACVEIAEGRDMDVLEIDAATHTGIDNVREVIIAGLAIRPVRNRYKVFIIDEVHQLSSASFNSLLKSIEEPPPHVVFMMATTELDKIPETVLSRSQVYEFRTIHTKAIADQLRAIVSAEGITVGDESLQLIARDADGSMRDAQSKLDQVIAFTGSTITGEDVSAVLGLVGRDLLLDTIQAVADEDAVQAFALAARAVEMGYDLRAVCRELSRVVRDLLVLSVDPSRLADPEIAGEGERDRLTALGTRFSREDLLRAFDLLTRAEGEIRSAAQPRYHLEMALLRWMYLRKLTPIEDLLAGGGPSGQARTSSPSTRSAAPPAPAGRVESRASAPAPARPAPPAPVVAVSRPAPAARASAPPARVEAPAPCKDALLAEIRRAKSAFYNTVVAQAQKVQEDADHVTFTFAPAQRTLREMFDEKRAWLEALALEVSGRKIVVAAVQGDPVQTPGADAAGAAAAKQSALRDQALADAGVQAMLEVFPAEIRDVEEM
ncbi:MAG TPA: DNA polymerase III subunit gamma/tau [Vicinamibacterales bacterium]|nr:DNA polymerase III subunit gamma/tau [Vicinamibacterales bacterium]